METRPTALGVALTLLVALDVLIARVDVFAPLVPDTRPATFFALINAQLTDAVRNLYGMPSGPRSVVLLGNSQMDTATSPVGLLQRVLVERGAPRDTSVRSLCVVATAPTDDEVLARALTHMRPDLVLIGLSPPDLGTPLERARQMPVTRLLDTGFRDGLVPPVDTEARIDRWVRTVWRLYRYRTLFRDLFLPPPGPRTLIPTGEAPLTRADLIERLHTQHAEELLRLYGRFEQTQDFADFVRYAEALQGPDYLPGLRERWRNLAPQPLQLEALRRTVAHARAAGGRPVWILLPENPLFARDPEVGADVVRGSDGVARLLAAEADALAVPLLDLRRALPPDAFADLNHVLPFGGALVPVLAADLAARGLLGEG